MSQSRRQIYFKEDARSWTAPPSTATGLIRDFHRQLPGFQPTALRHLPEVAKELGCRHVYLKDESDRLGLPSFKILGASWGTFRAVCRELGLPPDVSLDQAKKALESRRLTLFAATEGNHGRAVARMGSILAVPVEIHVPRTIDAATISLIEGEGAVVVNSATSYDAAVLDTQRAAEQGGGLLIQDYAFGGYQDIPQWIVEGYSTMMLEVDDQLAGSSVDLVVAPVGVGSLAQAVVSHFKQSGRSTSVLTVEPDTAACLWKSLQRGKVEPEQTTPTILGGLDCGTVSTIAWDVLSSGVDASLTISDFEAHVARTNLQGCHNVSVGPCGAATLAAVRRLGASDRARLGISKDSTILLLSTEGPRDYTIPLSVAADDVVDLTQTLVQVNSANPSLGPNSGPGETAIARYITAWLQHRDIETHWVEPTRGRPSVVGVVRGSGGGKTLMLNGHIDTVLTTAYDGDPLSGTIIGDKLFGRGSADMKGGVAAAMVALAHSKRLDLRGDVIFAGVADEEAESIGTEQILQAGWRADGAIVSEPTDLAIIHAHKGFVWLEVDVHGVAAHGSQPQKGVDAITNAGYFLVKLDDYGQRLQRDHGESPVGPPSVHASIIQGGQEPSSYPALCKITLERRTVASETPETVRREIQGLLDEVAAEVADFRSDLRVVFERPPFNLPLSNSFTSLVKDVVGRSLGHSPTFGGAPHWTDCALLSQAGIPSLLWGPRGEGLHAKEEWVDVASVRQVAEGLTSLAQEFCK